MKTTKVILVAAIMVFATIGFAQTITITNSVKPEPELPKHISVKTAMHIPGLAFAMRAQLSPRFLQVDQRMYTVTVKYNNAVYYIYGSLKAWKQFFAIKVLYSKSK